MRTRCRLVIILAALFLLCPTILQGASNSREVPKIEIKEWQLENGLRVIFTPLRRVPAVTVQVWYHVGSKNEHVGIRGVAHMFEHMMFKGSTHVLPEQHAQMISRLGGENNAFTAQDVTAYHNTLPRQYLGFALHLEAERMHQLHLTPGTIKSEREVVKEEKRLRLENSPIGRALEAMYALAYTKHPYAWTPAGDIPDLNRVTQQEVQDFYRRYYVPNNATVVVVGDTTEQEVRLAVAREFNGIPRGPTPPMVSVIEPTQVAYREKMGDWPTQLNVVLGAYHIPALREADIPALQVLAAVLSTGKSSRLNQSLVRKDKIALQAGGFLDAHEHPGLLVTYAVGLATHNAEKMKGRLLDEVERLTTEAVTSQELTKVKNQLATRFLNRLQTIDGLAMQMGDSTYLRGDPRAFLEDSVRYDQVSAADVKRVAATYLRRTNLSLVLLDSARSKRSGGGR
jgi:zinc protease